MLRIVEGQMILDLDNDPGRELALLVLQTIWTWGTQGNPETMSQVELAARMIEGRSPMAPVQIDLGGRDA